MRNELEYVVTPCRPGTVRFFAIHEDKQEAESRLVRWTAQYGVPFEIHTRRRFPRPSPWWAHIPGLRRFLHRRAA